jgi:hypothetical protein
MFVYYQLHHGIVKRYTANAKYAECNAAKGAMFTTICHFWDCHLKVVSARNELIRPATTAQLQVFSKTIKAQELFSSPVGEPVSK